MGRTKTIKYRRCLYPECALPVNNSYYWCQFALFLIGIAFLVADPLQFTAFAVFLFSAPILLDLVHNNNLNPKWLNHVRKLYIAVNGFIALLGFLSAAGIMVIDTGLSFKISDKSLIFSGVEIIKSHLMWFIIVDLIVPLMFYFGIPNQSTMKTVELVEASFKRRTGVSP